MTHTEQVVENYRSAWRTVRAAEKEMLETAKLLEPIWYNSYSCEEEMYEDAKHILCCDFDTFLEIERFYGDLKQEEYEHNHPSYND